MRQTVVDRLVAYDVETVFEASNFHPALDFIRDADAIVSDCGFPIVLAIHAWHPHYMGEDILAGSPRACFV